MYVSLLDSGGDERKHSRVAFIDGFGLAAVFPLCRSLCRSVGLSAALSAKSARPVPRRPPRGNWRTLDLLTHSLTRIATSGSGVSAGWGMADKDLGRGGEDQHGQPCPSWGISLVLGTVLATCATACGSPHFHSLSERARLNQLYWGGRTRSWPIGRKDGRTEGAGASAGGGVCNGRAHCARGGRRTMDVAGHRGGRESRDKSPLLRCDTTVLTCLNCFHAMESKKQ